MKHGFASKPGTEIMKKLQTLFSLNKFELLESETQELVKKYGSDANLQNILGISQQAQGKYDLSIKSFKQAIYLSPNLYLAHFNLGNVYKDTLNPFAAEKSYRECIQIKHDYIEAYIGLGTILLDLNKLNESILIFEKAIQIDPNNASLHRQLSEIRKYSKNNLHIQEMEKILLNNDNSDDQKMHISFALGKSKHDIGKFEEAFKYWEKGNNLKRYKINYSTEKQEKFFQTIKDNFSEEIFNESMEYGNKKKLIFIVGMPRSGTTLVQQILSTHPDVLGIGEKNQFSKDIINSFFDSNNLFKKNLYDYEKKHFEEIGEEYIKKIKFFQSQNLKNNSNNILVKDPLNFRWIGFIRLIFPNAKIIHCIRNPLDNCLSLYKTYFAGGVDFSYNLVELGEFYNLYLDLMKFWKKILPNFYVDISYERIIENKEKEIGKLLKFCDLKWEQTCMDFHKYIHPMSTGTNSINIHQPIYKSSMDYWKIFKTQLEPLIKVLKT